MTQLQEITIKVPLTIAEAYNQANEQRKQEIINKITFFLQPITTDKKVAIQQLRQIMAEIGQEAQARGLTPEILEEILNEDD
jgi:phage terminase small subunit